VHDRKLHHRTKHRRSDPVALPLVVCSTVEFDSQSKPGPSRHRLSPGLAGASLPPSPTAGLPACCETRHRPVPNPSSLPARSHVGGHPVRDRKLHHRSKHRRSDPVALLLVVCSTVEFDSQSKPGPSRHQLSPGLAGASCPQALPQASLPAAKPGTGRCLTLQVYQQGPT